MSVSLDNNLLSSKPSYRIKIPKSQPTSIPSFTKEDGVYDVPMIGKTDYKTYKKAKNRFTIFFLLTMAVVFIVIIILIVYLYSSSSRSPGIIPSAPNTPLNGNPEALARSFIMGFNTELQRDNANTASTVGYMQFSECPNNNYVTPNPSTQTCSCNPPWSGYLCQTLNTLDFSAQRLALIGSANVDLSSQAVGQIDISGVTVQNIINGMTQYNSPVFIIDFTQEKIFFLPNLQQDTSLISPYNQLTSNPLIYGVDNPEILLNSDNVIISTNVYDTILELIQNTKPGIYVLSPGQSLNLPIGTQVRIYSNPQVVNVSIALNSDNLNETISVSSTTFSLNTINKTSISVQKL